MRQSTSPALDKLEQKKFSIWICLKEQGISYNEVARRYDVSPRTLYRFVKTQVFQDVNRLMAGDTDKDGYMKILAEDPEIDIDGLIIADQMSQKEISKFL